MNSSPRIRYRALEDATPEAERAALADIYFMVLNDPENKAAGEDGGDDARKEIENGRDAKDILPE